MSAAEGEKRERFERYVQQVADQLWSEQTCLPEILGHPRLQQLSLQDELAGVQSYEELFRLLLANHVLVPDDFSVLAELLTQLGRQELLAPLYEENFGGKGLKISSGDRPLPAQRRAPQNASEFRFLLCRIGGSISQENLKTLLFLVRDLLPRSKLENVEEGSELFELVRQRNCIHHQRPEFLYTILRDIGRDDLRSMVDGYVYGHLRGHQSFPKCERVASCKRRGEDEAETENTRWFQQAYRYRLSLKHLADKLSHCDLESMKHLCKEWIPKGQLEKVDHTLDLFLALEDHGKLCKDDVSVLEDLLTEKSHLLHPLYATSLGSSQPNSRNNSLIVRSRRKQQPDEEYKVMLRRLGVGLGMGEIKKLTRLQHERTHATEGVKTGYELLQHWVEMGFISQQNTDFLQRCLTTIGRKDLLTHINAYRYFMDMQQLQQPQHKVHPKQRTTQEGKTDCMYMQH